MRLLALLAAAALLACLAGCGNAAYPCRHDNGIRELKSIGGKAIVLCHNDRVRVLE